MFMKKDLNEIGSCLDKARDGEAVFLLIGRDKAMGQTLRFWCRMRIALGLNTGADQQIHDVIELADRLDSMHMSNSRSPLIAGDRHSNPSGCTDC